jgi:dienelactone hydrolase
MRNLLTAGFVVILVSQLTAATTSAQKAEINKQRVTFSNDNLKLVGIVYKPDGPGPFPTLIWNHGSETDPEGGHRFDTVAEFFVRAGYSVFAPIRRGQVPSQGAYIIDIATARLRQRGNTETYGSIVTRLLETEQLQDQLEGIAYAKKLPFVDAKRLVVAGCSFGGIQTLLAAESGVDLKAAFSISPAALMWDGDPEIGSRLAAAVKNITMPVRLIQPPQDASLNPARVLGEVARSSGKASFATEIYPKTMPRLQQGHCFGGARGTHNWAPDALAFFNHVLEVSANGPAEPARLGR